MTYQLDARHMSRLQVHAYLMEILPLPPYYGRNLDALYDCLTELADTELVILHTEAAPASFDAVRQVISDAAKENPALTVEFED